MCEGVEDNAGISQENCQMESCLPDDAMRQGSDFGKGSFRSATYPLFAQSAKDDS